MVETKWSKTRV